VDATDLTHPLTATALERLLATVVRRGLDQEAVRTAAYWAGTKHAGQRRRSGEPYVTHCFEVATMVADLGGSLAMVQASLLHDVVEDTGTTLLELRREFGATVSRLVDGCTKVAAVHPDEGIARRQAVNLRKLFVSLAEDPRVVVVKLCDRLHNLRTIDALPAEKARRIGEETLAVHAPLAHRLGLSAIKAELEDRAYAVADPEGYAKTAERLAAADLHVKLEDARHELQKHLEERAFRAEVSGRIKHLWSVHRKARRLGADPLNLPDLLGLRIICENQTECFTALGLVHELWDPDLRRLRDYINNPKSNGYQSLHTTVESGDGRLLEVQIRTRAMHAAAEHGAAAHHAYKNGEEPAWVGRLLAWAGEDLTDEEYVTGVHDELGHRKEILVLTPRGEIVELPEGAVVVDFAYAIHSEIGDSCIGARVDGRVVPLNTVLQDGQRVEVLTGRREGPSGEWLEWVRTSKARTRIRSRLQTDAPAPVPAVEPRRTENARSKRSRTTGRTKPVRDRVPMAPGIPDAVLKIAGCCRPGPGQRVIGIVGRTGIRAHASDCVAVEGILAVTPGRTVPVHWVLEGSLLETLSLTCVTRDGLLTDLAGAVAGVEGSLHSVSTNTADLELVAEVPRRRRKDLRAALRLVDGVRSIH
jgi:guanosine-3',5'-bis(diphosphate) 3'-pyrophosphohydrolase